MFASPLSASRTGWLGARSVVGARDARHSPQAAAPTTRNPSRPQPRRRRRSAATPAPATPTPTRYSDRDADSDPNPHAAAGDCHARADPRAHAQRLRRDPCNHRQGPARPALRGGTGLHQGSVRRLHLHNHAGHAAAVGGRRPRGRGPAVRLPRDRKPRARRHRVHRRVGRRVDPRDPRVHGPGRPGAPRRDSGRAGPASETPRPVRRRRGTHTSSSSTAAWRCRSGWTTS